MKIVDMLCLFLIAISFNSYSQESNETISKKLADPTSDIWALFTAFEAFGFSGNAVDGTKWGGEILVEPIMPITLNSSLKLLMRPALPIAVGLPSLNGDTSVGSGGNTYDDIDNEYGLGNMQLPLMLSPITKSKFTWGLGPTFIIPTNTDDSLGEDVWEAGVAALGVYKPSSTVTFGTLSQYWWSIDPDTEAEDNSHAQIVVFGWQELGGGRSVGFGPTITYDAKRDGTKWNIPIGVNYAWMTTLGNIPTKIQIGADVSVVKNDFYDSDFALKLNIIPVVPSLF